MTPHLIASVLTLAQPGGLDSPQPNLPQNQTFLAAPALSEAQLAKVAGRAARPLTWRDLRGLYRDQAEGTERFIGSSARTQMDVWWGSIGSQLIANSVRAGGGA